MPLHTYSTSMSFFVVPHIGVHRDSLYFFAMSWNLINIRSLHPCIFVWIGYFTELKLSFRFSRPPPPLRLFCEFVWKQRQRRRRQWLLLFSASHTFLWSGICFDKSNELLACSGAVYMRSLIWSNSKFIFIFILDLTIRSEIYVESHRIVICANRTFNRKFILFRALLKCLHWHVFYVYEIFRGKQQWDFPAMQRSEWGQKTWFKEKCFCFFPHSSGSSFMDDNYRDIFMFVSITRWFSLIFEMTSNFSAFTWAPPSSEKRRTKQEREKKNKICCMCFSLSLYRIVSILLPFLPQGRTAAAFTRNIKCMKQTAEG